jgi:hypothetical protein
MENYVEFKFDQGVLTGVPSVASITEALRDLIRTALQEGYNKKSYTVGTHIKYLKNIQSARNPEAYVRSVARKTFPDDSTYKGKVARIQELYKGKDTLISKFEILYKLYYNLPRGVSNPWIKISAEEADSILEDLLSEA